MPSADEIQAGLTGAWRLMLGQRDGLDMLDLSADGFWNSFFAIVAALPAMIAMWSAQAITLAPGAGMFAQRSVYALSIGLIDIIAWILPLVAIAYALVVLKMADRISPFIVANNWGSAILAWVTMPAIVLDSLFPSFTDAISVLLLVLFVASIVLLWRLNNSALGKGAAVTTAIILAMIVVSLVLYSALGELFGIPGTASVS